VIEKIIQDEINKIIKSFYDKNRKIKEYIEKKYCYEPVHWRSDISCYKVKKKYIAYIKGATSKCNQLKNWLKKELEKKGYDIEIITEW